MFPCEFLLAQHSNCSSTIIVGEHLNGREALIKCRLDLRLVFSAFLPLKKAAEGLINTTQAVCRAKRALPCNLHFLFRLNTPNFQCWLATRAETPAWNSNFHQNPSSCLSSLLMISPTHHLMGAWEVLAKPTAPPSFSGIIPDLNQGRNCCGKRRLRGFSAWCVPKS